jgi:predicted nucleotidyltransferase
MEELSRGIFSVTLHDGRHLRVFVTQTYHFTVYTLEKVLSIDPTVNTIIISGGYSSYSDDAKRECIRLNIGLFLLREFMGAINCDGDKFVNYLLVQDRRERVDKVSACLQKDPQLASVCEIYLLGSYLRHKIYNDIDMIVVFKQRVPPDAANEVVARIERCLGQEARKLDFVLCSRDDFSNLELMHDNKERVL